MRDDSEWRWFTQGAAAACLFLLIFVVSGAVWSTFKIEGILFADHIYNGLVIATWANLASLLLGFSVGLTALLSVGDDKKTNSQLVGFGLMNFFIIGFLWWGGHSKLRDNQPPSISERLFDILDSDIIKD